MKLCIAGVCYTVRLPSQDVERVKAFKLEAVKTCRFDLLQHTLELTAEKRTAVLRQILFQRAEGEPQVRRGSVLYTGVDIGSETQSDKTRPRVCVAPTTRRPSR